MRSSGILMHLTSLPGPYGIGTLGSSASQFLDFLQQAGQRYWQILPLGPTGFGNSPYQSFSAFAGNPYLIDPGLLEQEGLLTPQELGAFDWGDAARVDYARLYAQRPALLQLAFSRFDRENSSFLSFQEEKAFWLEDYALFMALKERHGGAAWTEWPHPLRTRARAAMAEARQTLAEPVLYQKFLQYLFFTQWKQLRRRAHEAGVRLIGDVPFYVPLDSADVWSHPELFLLDRQLQPTMAAGVPPDAFSEDGQLWGNPIYDWQRMKKDGYAWQLHRLQAAQELVDVVRLDHFRGLESYWAVPFGARTAREGKWYKGPGIHLIRAISRTMPELPIIAEDLGDLTEAVRVLRRRSGYPGMKVLQFAFSAAEPSSYLPHNYESACVCYTGTHDNMTLLQWSEQLSAQDRTFAEKYLHKRPEEPLDQAVLRAGMGSVAMLFVAQMQDYLRLGAEARMNAPGTLRESNWCWRAQKEQLTGALAAHIRELAQLYGRL